MTLLGKIADRCVPAAAAVAMNAAAIALTVRQHEHENVEQDLQAKQTPSTAGVAKPKLASYPPFVGQKQIPAKSEDVLRNSKVTFLGCGNMGSALLGGWLKTNTLTPVNVSVNKRSQSGDVKELSDTYGFKINTNQHEQEKVSSNIAIIAVKPQQVTGVLEKSSIKAECYITVAAGLPLKVYEEILGKDTPIIRAMPNTPAAIGHGMTAIIANTACRPEHIENAKTLFKASGEVVVLSDENQMHAFTALAGSGPAYVFATIEAWEKIALEKGFTSEQARTIAYQTVVGTANYADQSETTATQLRINVTSPGGTTAAGLKEFGIEGILRRTVDAATIRSEELGK